MTKVKLLDYMLQEGFSCAYTYALFAEDVTQTAVSIRRDMFNRMDVYNKLIYKITGVSHTVSYTHLTLPTNREV